MRSRTTRVLLAVLACASPALAQELHRVGSTIAHLSYDLRTGELGLAASLSPGVAQPVYDNTCDGFYYARLRSAAETGGQKEEAIIDWGLLPSSAFPGNSLCTSGCADTYSIDELTIAYCTIADGLVDGRA